MEAGFEVQYKSNNVCDTNGGIGWFDSIFHSSSLVHEMAPCQHHIMISNMMHLSFVSIVMFGAAFS